MARWKRIVGLWTFVLWVAIMINCLRITDRIKTKGLKAARQEKGPLVIVANHPSALETYAIPGVLYPRHPFLIIDDKLFIGILCWLPSFLSGILVSRQNDKAKNNSDAIKKMMGALRSGHSLLIFPEGGRTMKGLTLIKNNKTLRVCDDNIITIAKKCNAKIMPVWVDTRPDQQDEKFFCMRNVARLRYEKMRLCFGEAKSAAEVNSVEELLRGVDTT